MNEPAKSVEHLRGRLEPFYSAVESVQALARASGKSEWWGGVAWLGMLSAFFILTFYCVVSAWFMAYIPAAVTGAFATDAGSIDASMQRYMFMFLATNVLVGLATWIALIWCGLENAGAWAVAAGLLHIVPYFGPAVTAAFIGMAAFMQFESLSTALLIGGISLAIATVVGYFVTTWMTGRIAKMNTAAVFVSLLFWAWLWGVWGLLLSIPITVILKVVAQHVEQLEPVAELLGD